MDPAPLNAFLQKMLSMGVPGCELAVCVDHEIVFHECAGFSDAACQRPTAPEDRWWLYSCTKPVTAAAAQRALEQGLFTLDTPVSRFLPGWAEAHVIEDGVRVPVEVTVRHLLTMTAGLNYDRQRPSLQALMARTGGTAGTVEVADTLGKDPLCFRPGTKFQYSLCHDVLGAVIEAASGLRFRDYVGREILEPLGMKDAEFFTDTPPFAHMAALWTYDAASKKRSLSGPGNSHVLSPNFDSGGAGLVSTALDYLKFADAMACGGIGANGARVLQAESIDRMRTEQLTAMGSRDFSCTCGADYGYGLGVRTRTAFREGGMSAPGEFGWDGAAGADLTVDPAHRLSAVYVQHVLGWPSMQGIVHLQLRDVLYPALGLV